MALQLSAIRSGITQQIENISGFHLVKMLPDYFGRAQESIAHKGFTVQIASTSERTDERQRRSIGVYASTSVIIRFAYRLRPMDVYPTDYDNALDAEESVLLACLNSYASIEPRMQIRYNTTTRESTESNEYILTTISFTVLHTIGD
jgi:hypothetical protein